MTALPVHAALRRLLTVGALLSGAAIGYFIKQPRMAGASIMVFGIGVLIWTLAFDLMDEATAAASVSVTIAIGPLPDGVPESAAIGMKATGKSVAYVFSIWSCFALACGVSAFRGQTVIGTLEPSLSEQHNLRGGGNFAMLIDTIIPEAFDGMHNSYGPIVATGLLFAFAGGHLL